MNKLKEQEALIQTDLQKVNFELGDMPSEQQIRNRAKVVSLFRKKRRGPTKNDMKKLIDHSYFGSEAHLNEMTFDDKRQVLQSIFPGKDGDGKRYGVYLNRNKDGWNYKVEGLLQPFSGTLGNEFKLRSLSQD